MAQPVESGLTNPMGVAALVFTKDDYLLFGLRSEQVTTFRNLLGVPVSGVVDDVERFKEAGTGKLLDLAFEELFREAVEELHLSGRSLIAMVKFLGLARDLNRGGPYNFFFSLELAISLADLAARLRGNANREYSCFYAVHRPQAETHFIEICNDLIRRTTLDGQDVGNELRANLLYLRDSLKSAK